MRVSQGASARLPGRRRQAFMRRLVVIAAGALGLLVALITPAQAGTSWVSHDGGANVKVVWTFHGKQMVSLTFTVADTKCNAASAWGDVGLRKVEGIFISYHGLLNDLGCGTTKTHSTGPFSTGFDILSLQICADGDGVGKKTPSACGSWHDNPYT